MSPKHATRVRTSLTKDMSYSPESVELDGLVKDEDVTVTLFGAERPAELYTVTHSRYGSEVTQQRLVITDRQDDSVSYIYGPDPAEMTEGSRARAPYSLLALGRRWVPVAVQDAVNTWDISGAERDYTDPVIALMEAYWRRETTAHLKPDTQTLHNLLVHITSADAAGPTEDAVAEIRERILPYVDVAWVLGWLDAREQTDIAAQLRMDERMRRAG